MASRVGGWLLVAPFLGVWAAAAAVVVEDDVDRQIRFWEARQNTDPDPEDDIAPTKLGTAYLMKGRRSGDYSYYLKAETTLRRAIAINPQNYDTRVSLAFALGAQHKFRDAIELAEQAIKDRPGEPAAYGILGDAALETGDLKRAESAYATLVEQDQGLFAYGRLANLQQTQGNPAGALSSLAKAIDAGKVRGVAKDEIARCYVSAGEIHAGHGRWDEAESQYRAALEITPGGYLPLEHLAELRAAQKHYDEAMALYLEVIALSPRPEFFEALGDVYSALGRADEAKSARQKALAGYTSMVDQGDIGYFRHLAHFYSDVQPDPAAAIRWAKRDLEVRPEVLSYDTLAWAYHRAGEGQAAVEAIAKALAIGTNDARVLYHAGMIHHHSGSKESARVYLKRALEVNPNLAEVDEIRRLLADR